MSGHVDWIAAAQSGELRRSGLPADIRRANAQETEASKEGAWKRLPKHEFALPRWPESQETVLDRNPDAWMYRDRTVGILRRYVRFSLETGRLPSIVGRELFRAKVSSYPAATFEDRVIFVRDVEKCLERLEYWDQQLIARVVLQEHSQHEAAYLLHCNRKTVQRRLQEVLDILSEDFLRVGLLVEFPGDRNGREG